MVNKGHTNITYRLNSQDYLQQVLYVNSRSEPSKKQRKRAWLFVVLMILILSLLLVYLFMDKIELGHYLGAIPVLILGIFTFPFFHKKMLKRQFLEFVNESYKNSFDKETKLSFCNDHIEIQNSTGESKIQYSSLAKIIEISSHFFIVIKAGAYIVLPKSEIPNMVGIRTTLQSIAKENEISYSSELDWKWI